MDIELVILTILCASTVICLVINEVRFIKSKKNVIVKEDLNNDRIYK